MSEGASVVNTDCTKDFECFPRETIRFLISLACKPHWEMWGWLTLHHITYTSLLSPPLQYVDHFANIKEISNGGGLGE